MQSKKDHLNFIKKKGIYIIDCISVIFSTEELNFLRQYGHWCEALIDGTLQPLNMKQEQFIRVAKGELEPETMAEQAWMKLKEARWQNSQQRDREDRIYVPAQDTFHNRDMAKQMKRMMYGEMRKNHREI